MSQVVEKPLPWIAVILICGMLLTGAIFCITVGEKDIAYMLILLLGMVLGSVFGFSLTPYRRTVSPTVPETHVNRDRKFITMKLFGYACSGTLIVTGLVTVDVVVIVAGVGTLVLSHLIKT